MTDEEWATCGDPDSLVRYIRNTANARKLRLFACACCRSVWAYLWSEASYRGVLVAEQFADGFRLEEELTAARDAVRSQLELYPDEPVYDPVYWACEPDLSGCLHCCTHYAGYASTKAIPTSDRDYDAHSLTTATAEIHTQVNLLREIFGNPFRPATFSPAWRTTDVMLLAKGIYDARAFDRMPILADALQDAGCDIEDILNHLRNMSATHVRGCWALDSVLGKE